MLRHYFYFINILFSIGVLAQGGSKTFLHENSIQLLSNGSLLVRLPSEEKKISFFENQKKIKDCDSKCQKKMDEEILEITSQRDTFNSLFIKSFKRYFKFCPVYFYYDKDHDVLQNADYVLSLYLDENLNYKSIPFIHKDSLLILKKDRTPNSENEGWLFQTMDGKTLHNDFPYITQNNFTTLMNRLSYKNHVKENCKYMVKKLNKQLYSYLAEVNEKKEDARKAFEEEEGF